MPSHDLCTAYQYIGPRYSRLPGRSTAPQEVLEAPRTPPGLPGDAGAGGGAGYWRAPWRSPGLVHPRRPCV